MFSHGLMGSWGFGAPRDPENSGESNADDGTRFCVGFATTTGVSSRVTLQEGTLQGRLGV